MNVRIFPENETQLIEEGTSYELICNAFVTWSSNTSIEYYNLHTAFYKNRVRIYSAEMLKCYNKFIFILLIKVLIQENEQNYVIYKIEKVKKSDQGEYICYGYTPDRATYSAYSIKLIVGMSF